MSALCHKVGLRVQQYRAQIGGLHQVDEDKTYGTLFVFGSVGLFAASLLSVIMLVLWE